MPGAGCWPMGAAGGGGRWGSRRREKGTHDAGSHLASGQPPFAGGRGDSGPGAFLQGANLPLEKEGMAMLEGAEHIARGLQGYSGRGTPTPKGAGHHGQQGGCC